MKKFILSLLLSACYTLTFTQVIWTEPAFPTQDDIVTLYYDATQGNGDLTGVIPIYIHTGVITTNSANGNDWQHVIGNWGTADNQVLMTPLGGNIHSFNFGGVPLSDFYNLSAGEDILELAMVFRNQNGSSVGREADGGDIFFPISDGSFSAIISSPTVTSVAINPGESVSIAAQSSAVAALSILLNGAEVASVASGTSIDYTFTETLPGQYSIEFTANNGSQEVLDELTIIVLPDQIGANAPAGTIDGINYISGTSVVLQLHAPNKEHVFVVGDFNDWQFDLNYLMTPTTDGQRFWIQLDGLTAGQEYRFQYHILPDNMRIADIYADKILDYWNDPWIPESTYPNLLDFPVDETGQEAVSVLQTNQPVFNWTDQDYERPNKENLVIYELLIRDWIAAHDYQTLTDSLDYLQNLGITAIQLMPVNEFEGNISWGYNPAFYFAPDKYYGNEESFKTFVDECHNRGMAVIMDIALNHSFGSNPQVRMYFNPNAGPYGQPTAENPWFNETPRHDFNVGYDYDHSSPATKEFTKRVLRYWVQEYHIDGYRMDLSKGFTQNNTLGNIGAWNAYDQSRIDILTDYANDTWAVAPETYYILEHFADNSEETVLSNSGFLLWGNLNYQYSEASMGYASDLSWGVHTNRGWNNPHLVTYAESHDEERVMYKNLEFGNSNGSYNITSLNTALARMELTHCFLLPIPGPKMIWQFGELGYDYSLFYCSDGSLSEGCKTDPKPIVWEYQEVQARKRLYKVTAALAKLKADYPVFQTTDFDTDFGGYGKRMHLNSNEMNVTVVGNFDVSAINMIPGFQHTGTWYDYFTGNTIEVTDLNAAMPFQPGEYHLYTDIQLPLPDLNTTIDDTISLVSESIDVYPNPSSGSLSFIIPDAQSGSASIVLFDIAGRKVHEQQNIVNGMGAANSIELPQHLEKGVYLFDVRFNGKHYTTQIILN